MIRKLLGLLAVLILTCAHPAEGQQSKKVPRIGYLAVNSFSDNAARIDAFRQKLRELGYVDGKNIIIEWRSAEGKPERLPTLAAELVSLKVDVLVSYGPTTTRAAKKATTTVPIVMSFDSDPVGSGVVTSLAQPGGNITGLSSLAPEISGKQLELLKEIVPALSRIAVLGNSTQPDNAPALKELELAAGPLKVQIQYLDVLSAKDIEPSFQSATKRRAGAVLVLAGPVMSPHRTELLTWRQRTGCQRCTTGQIMSKPAVSCPTERIFPIYFGVPQLSSTKF
jgi:putative tryptophan/tyrosine transport system substrate-binding protein